MTEKLAARAGSAFFWRSVQQFGVQALYLVRTLVLARLLLPEHFGLVAIGTTSVGVALSLSNFGTIPALVQLRQAERIHYDTAWTVGLVRALAITAMIFVLAPMLADAFGEPGATNVIRALALRPLLEAIASIQVAALTRSLRFRALAALHVPAAIVDLAVAVSLAEAFGVWAMVVGTLAGAMTLVTLSYVVAPHMPRLVIDYHAAGSLIRFGRWIFLRAVLAVAAGFTIQLVISRNLGVAALGLYALAGRIAFLPQQVASEVVGSVAFPLYARLQDDKKSAAATFTELLKGLACLLLPTYVILIALAPAIVEQLLGPRWAGTEPIIQMLALVGIIGMLGDTAVPLIQGLGRPQKVVVVDTVQTLILVAVVGTLAMRFGAVGAASAWIPAVLASQFLCVRYVNGLVPNPFLGLARPLLATLLVSGLAGVVASLLGLAITNPLGPIIAGALAFLLAASMLWILDRRLSLGFVEGILKLFPKVDRFVRRT